MADRYDRKKILIMGWALWVPVPLFFALATSWTQLPLGMFLYGVLFSGPASSAYIVGQAAKGKMTSTFTLLVSAWGVGYMLAPTLAGFLAEALGMRWVFFLTTVFYFITTILLTQISSQHPKKDEVSAEEAQKTWDGSPFRRGRIFLLSTLFASVMFLLSLVFPLVPQFLSDVYRLDIVQIGILGSFTYLGGSTLSLIMGRIGDRHGKTTAVSIAMILVAIALTIFICVDSFASLIFASFLRGASFPMWAFIGATVGPIAPVASRARWISVVQTVTQVVSILAPYVGGILYAHSPQAPFLLTIGGSVMLALIAQTPLFKERVASDTLRSVVTN